MSPARILVLYEGLPVLALIAEALKSWGHQVTVAKDARHAALALEDQTFDLVILKWPGEPQVAALLLKLNPPTRVLVLSEARKLPERLGRIEVAGCIFLPCRAVHLWKQIAEHLNRLSVMPASTPPKIQLHPVNRRVYHKLVTIFNEMTASVLSMAYQMELLHQKAENGDDHKLAALCQLACHKNQKLWEIMREIRDAFLLMKPLANPEPPRSPRPAPLEPSRRF